MTLTRRQVEALSPNEFYLLMANCLSRVMRAHRAKGGLLGEMEVGQVITLDRDHHLQTNEKNKARIELDKADAQWSCRRVGGKLKVKRTR